MRSLICCLFLTEPRWSWADLHMPRKIQLKCSEKTQPVQTGSFRIRSTGPVNGAFVGSHLIHQVPIQECTELCHRGKWWELASSWNFLLHPPACLRIPALIYLLKFRMRLSIPWNTSKEMPNVDERGVDGKGEDINKKNIMAACALPSLWFLRDLIQPIGWTQKKWRKIQSIDLFTSLKSVPADGNLYRFLRQVYNILCI